MTRGRPPVHDRGPVLAGVALIGVVLAAVAVGLPGRAGAQQAGGRVVVVSDSIVAGAERQLTDDLASDGRSVVFDAQISRTAYSAAGAVAAHDPGPTDTFVISLGVNDGAGAAAFRSRVDSVLAEVREVPRVFWVNLHEVRDAYGVANRVLAEAAAEHPNLTVLDWNSIAAARPELTVSDGLHLTGAGAEAMTELIGTAVRAAPATPSTTTPSTTAPSTTAPAPTTVAETPAAPTTAAPTEDPAARVSARDEPVADRAAAAEPERSSAWRSIAEWTVGGFAAVVIVLVLAGAALAAWSLWAARPSVAPPTTPSKNHPAVRARQRAERIAAASVEAQKT